jgi:hypothetical protein
MRYCLPCHAEYILELHTCPTCGSRLLSEEERRLWLDAQEELSNQTFVPVHVLDGPVEKALIPAILTDAGVPHLIRGDTSDAFTSAFFAQRGWGVVLVPEDDVSWARDVIRAYTEATVPEEEETTDPEEKKPL